LAGKLIFSYLDQIHEKSASNESLFNIYDIFIMLLSLFFPFYIDVNIPCLALCISPISLICHFCSFICPDVFQCKPCSYFPFFQRELCISFLVKHNHVRIYHQYSGNFISTETYTST